VNTALRIVYVINDLGGGGAERIAITAATALDARGHHSLIVTLRPEQAFDVATRVVHLTKRIPRGFPAVQLAAIRLRSAIARALGGPADMVISSFSGADRVVRSASIANSWHWIHNTLSAQLASNTDPHKATRNIAHARRRYDHRNLIAVSRGVASDLHETIGCRSANIKVIYNPFDLREIRRLAVEPPSTRRSQVSVRPARWALYASEAS